MRWVGLGAMMFGDVASKDHDEGVRVIHPALAAGINLVDTAEMCPAGESEVIVGKALQGRRDDVVLATKVHFPLARAVTAAAARAGRGSRRAC